MLHEAAGVGDKPAPGPCSGQQNLINTICTCMQRHALCRLQDMGLQAAVKFERIELPGSLHVQLMADA